MKYIINRYMCWYVAAMAGLLALFGCTNEEDGPQVVNPPASETVVNITVSTPPSSVQRPGTRVQQLSETAISTVKVAVFNENNLLSYIADGTMLQAVDYQTSFNVRLRSSSAAITLYIIANYRDAFDNSEMTSGITLARFQQLLSMSYPQAGLTADFPMAGKVTLPSLDATQSNQITGIKMLRAIARADVVIDPSVALTRFEMKEARIYRADKLVSILPSPEPADWSSPSVTAPTVTGSRPSNAWDLSAPTTPVSITASNQITAALYLPETAAVSDEDNRVPQATCIVVGGLFMGSGDMSYYRIDFNSMQAGHPYGQILRNRQYVFNVTQVYSNGWPTPEQAASNYPSGIVAEVQDWEAGITDMYFDGSHYLGVSDNRHAVVKYRAGSTTTISVTTDLPVDYSIEWVDANGNSLGTEGPGNSFTSTYFNVRKDPNPAGGGTSLIHFEALTRNDDQARVEYMHILAGRWEILVTITQETSSSNANRTVRVFSPSGTIGSLGTNSGTSGTNSTAAMKTILLNQDYFGPGGVVRMLGFDFDNSLTYENTTSGLQGLTPVKLATMDIIFLPYNSRPNDATAQNILDWLAADSHRVLMLGFDWKTSSLNILTASTPETADATSANIVKKLWNEGQISPMWFNGGSSSIPGNAPSRTNTFFAPLNTGDEAAYFWRDGPFTSGDYTQASTSRYYNSDAYYGALDIALSSPNIIPLFTDPEDSGRMLNGVDPVRRIVYVGDSQWYDTNSTGGPQDGRIQGTSGVFQDGNGYARIMANIWAWMIEEVVFSDNE